jgi:hypothetical protein
MTQLCFDDALEFDRLMRQKLCRHKWLEVPQFDHEQDEVYHIRVCLKCGLKED